jgi:oxygen-independent coproporphyrinogen-3 oxidase
LYIHIPFCRVKCRFCAFAAYPGRLADVPRYLEALRKDIASLTPVRLDTLYFGGGTPTLLSPADWRLLIKSIRDVFPIAEGPEVSVECNPDDASPELLSVLRDLGVNRLSVGLQSTQDHHLRTLGRLHDYARFERAWTDARAAGFTNLNIDLMYGLPGQTMDEWKETLDRALALGSEHLSAYALTVEEKTAFRFRNVEPDDDLQADMYETLSDRMEGAGFLHYEISNFAKPGFECRHNLKYWRNENCLGAGVSAAWFWDGVRRKNTENLTDYMEALEKNISPVLETVKLSEPEQVGESVMLGLRTRDGARLTGRAEAIYGDVLRRHAAQGLLKMTPDRVFPTRRGWLLSNRVFVDLLEG